MVGRQGFSLLRRRPLRRFRALRAALANAHAFTQLRAPTGSNPCRGNKKATNRSRSLSILWWAVRGSACSAGGRCGAFAPCALRWQTLTRLLSSAPRRVRTRVAATKKRPTGVDRFLFYGGPSGVQPASQAAAAALSRLARCDGKCPRVCSAPRPDGFELVARPQKSGRHPPVAFLFYGGPSGVRTLDLGIKSPLLCQLS